MGEFKDRISTIYITRKKFYATKLWPAKFAPATKFIILCQPRTGSTLLHTLLNSHPNVYSYGEILRKKAAGSKNFSLKKDVFKNHPKSISAVGLKIFYHYSEDVTFQHFFNNVLADSQIKVIHLNRENQLSSFISLKKAEISNEWSQEANISASSQEIKLNISEFKQYLDHSNSLKESIADSFKNHSCLNINYEMLTSDQDTCMKNVQGFLGVRQRKLFTILKKQGSAKYQTILNYDDLFEFYEQYNQQ